MATKKILHDRYRLDTRLDDSGRATVYRAWDLRLERNVIVKIARVATLRSNADREAFLHKARTLAGLIHPNVVTVLDGEMTEGRPYLVQELLDGPTLRERLQDGPLPTGEAIQLALKMADVLATATAEQLLLLDITPDTIVFCEGLEPKLASFEVSRGEDSDGRSMAYLAPEVLAGEPVDERADAYTLGVLLHELVTGTLPENLPQSISPGQKLDPAVPSWLSAIISRATASDPFERFNTPEELAQALEQATGSTTRPAAIVPAPLPPALIAESRWEEPQTQPIPLLPEAVPVFVPPAAPGRAMPMLMTGILTALLLAGVLVFNPFGSAQAQNSTPAPQAPGWDVEPAGTLPALEESTTPIAQPLPPAPTEPPIAQSPTTLPDAPANERVTTDGSPDGRQNRGRGNDNGNGHGNGNGRGHGNGRGRP